MHEPPDLQTILDAAVAALAAHERALNDAQEPLGLDALGETHLHDVLASGIGASGLGVHREVHLPGVVEQRRRRTSRDRCDLVLTAHAGCRLLDPVEELRTVDRATGTLFEPLAAGLADPTPPGEQVAEPEDASWIEVKTAHRIRYVNGVPGHDPRYASRLIDGPADDITKLALETRIHKAGVLVIAFGEDRTSVEHDLTQMAHALLDRGLPIGSPLVDGCEISDRVGNGFCGVALVPVRL